MKEKCIHLRFESKVENVPLVGKAIRGICLTAVENEQQLSLLELCIVEAVSNVIKHAYSGEEEHEVEVSVYLSPEQLTVHIIDSGKEIARDKKNSWQMLRHPQSIQEVPTSGFGLLILAQVMDEISHFKEGEKNITCMKKKLTAPHA